MTWAAFVKTAYGAARSWELQPSEFWALSPQEWWWEFDQHLIEQRRMTKGTGGISQADWAAARRKHKERFGNG